MKSWRAPVLLSLVLADVAVVSFLVAGSRMTSHGTALGVLFVVHAGCAAGFGVASADAAPRFLRRAPQAVAVFIAVMAFFLPVLGALGALVTLLIGFGEPRPPAREPWIAFDPERDAEEPTAAKRPRRAPRAAAIRATLGVRTPETAAQRFEAVLATRRLSTKAAVPLLKIAQTDPSDEIRLYAFSRLEGMRNDLERRIEEIGAALASAPGGEETARLHLRLAEAHWELGYAGLAEGVVLEHALDSARRHAALASEMSTDRASAEFLLGRVHLSLRHPERAQEAFDHAVASGYPRIKILAYLAECAFHGRDFRSVRRLLRELETSSREHVFFRPVLELWQERAPEERSS